jgi:Uri superfamily endonuclease
MVYALHIFRHYMLSNRFTFFVDHMALIYLINKPHVFSKLARWLLLFLEYDFKIVYKPGRSHIMANVLSTLPNHIEPIGVPDQTCDAHMFTLQSKWLQNVYEYLLERVMPKRLTTSQR